MIDIVFKLSREVCDLDCFKLNRSLFSRCVTTLIMAAKETNSNGTVFEFVVTDGDNLNFWRFKAMNIGF